MIVIEIYTVQFLDIFFVVLLFFHLNSPKVQYEKVKIQYDNQKNPIYSLVMCVFVHC